MDLAKQSLAVQKEMSELREKFPSFTEGEVFDILTFRSEIPRVKLWDIYKGKLTEDDVPRADLAISQRITEPSPVTAQKNTPSQAARRP